MKDVINKLEDTLDIDNKRSFDEVILENEDKIVVKKTEEHIPSHIEVKELVEVVSKIKDSKIDIDIEVDSEQNVILTKNS